MNDRPTESIISEDTGGTGIIVRNVEIPPAPPKPRARPNHKTIEMARREAAEWQGRYERECARSLASIVRERFFRSLLKIG